MMLIIDQVGNLFKYMLWDKQILTFKQEGLNRFSKARPKITFHIQNTLHHLYITTSFFYQ